ncbi:amidohydrolase [Cnuibacter physcomitrellae]|uniref:Amidohydrolase n=1 Tax=Cnuibacter physcomitrellae TaxID=1619308 RepID=A0A1X9LJF2_9MICO|nr:amidohydrolase family protein [Cnuibacter physcomitrellae]ARJ04051.1 amidohydrolase [Cnuibacter physcomitrellae]GGI40121.1 amidohydrolase [Cnuibacter physcomitrellae]
MGLIAIEEHWNLPALTDEVRRLPEERGDPSIVLDEMGDNLERLDDLGDLRLAMMDEQGIDVQVLSLAPPGTHPLDPTAAVEWSARANDIAARAVAAHPDRFRAFASLPLPDPTAAATELERAAGLGLVGAMVYGRAGAIPLDDPRNDEVFATAARLGLPVFIHPQVPSRTVRDAAYSGFGGLTDLGLATFGWGWHLEAALAALRLIVAGTFDRHPELQIVLGHWGELLLFWKDRIASLARTAGLERSMLDYLRENVWITSSGMLDPALLRQTLEVTTPDRLLFSTDYPFQRPSRADIRTFLAAFPGEEARTAFAEGNARRLLRLPG